MDNITLDKIVNSHNVDGDIYISDLDIWFGYKIELEKVREIRDKIMQIKRGEDGKDN